MTDEMFRDDAYLKSCGAVVTAVNEALKLGVYPIEESRAGPLRVQYGTPHCLERLRV